MIRMRHVRQITLFGSTMSVRQYVGFCLPWFFYYIRVHQQLQCCLCGVVCERYLLLVRHFLWIHMQMNISRLVDLLRIDVRLRDILLCHASPDDMQNDGDLSSQFPLQHGYTTSNVVASLVKLIIAQSTTHGGTNSVMLQIDRNLVDMSLNQSPVSSVIARRIY